jgi:hypothetical protein
MLPAEDTDVPSSEITGNPDTCSEIQTISPSPPLPSEKIDIDGNKDEKNEDDDVRKHESVATVEKKITAMSGEAAKILPDNCNTTATIAMMISSSEDRNNSKPPSTTVPRGTAVTNSITNNNETNDADSESTREKSSVMIIMPPTKSVVRFQKDHLLPMNSAASISDEDNSAMKSASASSSSSTGFHHLEPEGLRNKRVSRRFDEAELKEVMMKEEEKEGKKNSEADHVIPSTIIEEEEEPQYHPTQTERNRHLTEDSIVQVDSESSGSGTATHEKPRHETAISKEEKRRMSREPPGTPAREPEDTTVVPAESIPPLPLQAIAIDESSKQERQWNDYMPTDNVSLPPKESLEIASPHNEDQQGFQQSLAMPQQAFTSQVPQNLHLAATLTAAPQAALASAHLHNMDINSVARTSLSSVISNGYHHANTSTTNGLVAYPNGEVGIPHMPPLVLSQTNGSYHGLPAALAPAPPVGGKRRIHFRLVEDVSKPDYTSLFATFRKRSILRKNPVTSPIDEKVPSHIQTKWVDRGSLTVSWYEGTSSIELQEHVRNSVIRKLRLQGTTKLADFRILDDSVDPPEGTTFECFIRDVVLLLLNSNDVHSLL